MATIADSGYPTLINVVNRLKPDGSVETNLANTLTKKMPMLKDIPWVEGNLATGHRIISVTGLPSPTWRKLNQGLAPTKATTLPYDESCGMLEAYSKVDVDVAKLNGNEAAYRMTEDETFLESFNQEFSRSLFYENVTVNQERFHGFTPRYAATTGYTASGYTQKGPSGNSGSGCYSVWLINWDPNKVACIYPKGSVAGLIHQDLGQMLVPDSNNLQMLAYVSRFQWKPGLMVKDFRYVDRFQYDPVNDTTNFGPSAKGLYLGMLNQLTAVYELLPTARYYMSRTAFGLMQSQLAANSLNYLKFVSEGGERVAEFNGVPIRFTDTLVAETAIA